MRCGVFGGTFDPVHRGHLLLAECCQRQARLDRVLFVPAAQQPHKPRPPRASGDDRAAMLRLAIEGRAEFAVSTVELERGGRSYTVDTLRALRAREPDAELFLLMGADALGDLPRWREAAAICGLALPVAVRRAGHPEPNYAALAPLVSPARLDAMMAVQVEMPETPISSSEIQRLIATGGAWRHLVPPAVAEYIVARSLYGAELPERQGAQC
jgi:nicotinate-nucleotide adenylyltransferase